MAADDFRSFFNPEGVVIVGARRSMGFGFGLPAFLKKHGWGDRTFLVNPAGGEISGLTVYQKIADVPDPVDLAIVIVPANAVAASLTEIAARGIVLCSFRSLIQPELFGRRRDGG